MEKEKRLIKHTFKTTEAEAETIRRKMEALGIRNESAYMRAMALNGYILKLDLPQLERAGNTYAVSYVPLGFDAAVYWGVTDYRFYNALEIPIEIRARLEDGELTVELWGQTEQTWNIELKNELLGENVVETFRVYLDETGNIQREELIDVTRYESRE